MKKCFLYEKDDGNYFVRKKKLHQPFARESMFFFVSTSTTTTNFAIENIRDNSAIRYEDYLDFVKGVLLP